MTDTLALVRRLAADERVTRSQQFVAPLWPDGRVRLRVAGLVANLRVDAATPGWWQCRVIDAFHAAIEGEAEPWQRGEYLACWPAVRLVLVSEVAAGSWLAVPAMPGVNLRLPFPLVVHLVDGGQPFERVIGRVEEQTVWFDDLDRRGAAATAEQLRAALTRLEVTPQVRKLVPGEIAAYALCLSEVLRQRRRSEHLQIADRLGAALALGGAHLVGFTRTHGRFRVTWEREEQRSVTMVDSGFEVVDSGICLNGLDRQFDLTSVIGVIHDSPWHTHMRERDQQAQLRRLERRAQASGQSRGE